jgi:acetoin utilization deacetylase AcuC-like enzyme
VKKTGYFTHRDCHLHEMGRGHPECPERLSAIDDRLLATGVLDALDRREPPMAPLADLELAHSRMYVASVRGLTDALRDDVAAGGPTHAQVDPDTSMNIHTWDAALRAAGAALAATDAVMAGDLENAFCSVRPPGHHACKSEVWASAFSTMWQWLRDMRWSVTGCKEWLSWTSMCIMAMAQKTSSPATSAY